MHSPENAVVALEEWVLVTGIRNGVLLGPAAQRASVPAAVWMGARAGRGRHPRARAEPAAGQRPQGAEFPVKYREFQEKSRFHSVNLASIA